MNKVSAVLLALSAVCFGQSAAGTRPASDNIVVVGNQAQPVQWEHATTIQKALQNAGPLGIVIIPGTYVGTDCTPLSACSPGSTLIIDLRGGLFQTFPPIVGGGGGVGTVTAVGSGSLPPLFTVGVNNSTTTPFFTFSLSNAAAHAMFGNHTGVLGPPSYGVITTSDLPGGGSITVNGTGCALGSTCTLTLNGSAFANEGTTHTVLHGNAAGNQSYSAVDLSADVVGSLDHTHLNGGAGADGTKAWFGDDTWKVPPSAALTVSGTPTNGMNAQFTAAGVIQGTVPGFPGFIRSTATDTIHCDTGTVPNDRLHSIEYTVASTVTLPSPGTAGCGNNFTFKVVADFGLVTISPAGGATITYSGIGAGPQPAASSLPIPGGSWCVINSPTNANWLATCYQGNGPGKLRITSATDDFCTAFANYMAAAQTANVPSPIVDATEVGGPLTCSAVEPFGNWQVGWSGGELRFSTPILTDWPWIIPTKFSITGNTPGDCSAGPNAGICATATFRTNFPAFRGCTTGCPNTSTVVFATNTNIIKSGTNVAGTPTLGGTANFGGTCSAVTAGKMCGMNFHICPAASAACDRSDGGAINLGRVVSVDATGAGTSQLHIEVNTHSPITIPTAGTGYQWYAEMPVVQLSTLGNNCTGSGNACISNTQWLQNFAIDAGDGASDIHSGYENEVGQEGVGTLNLTARNTRGGCFGLWSTGIQDSGPYINFRCGGNSNIVFPVTIPLVVWQPGYLRQIIGMSLVTANIEPVDMLYCNTINQGGVEVTGGNHMESAALALQLGCTTVWPWAAGGTGARGRFSGLSGNGTTGNLVEIKNISTTNDLKIEFSAGGGATNCVIDDRIGLTIPCGTQQGYKVGADLFADGIATQNCTSAASPAVCGSATEGAVVIAAGATTVAVNTSNISTSSNVSLTEDSSIGTRLGVTCNTTLGRTYSVVAKTGSGFTIATSAAPVTNPACLIFKYEN